MIAQADLEVEVPRSPFGQAAEAIGAEALLELPVAGRDRVGMRRHRGALGVGSAGRLAVGRADGRTDEQEHHPDQRPSHCPTYSSDPGSIFLPPPWATAPVAFINSRLRSGAAGNTRRPRASFTKAVKSTSGSNPNSDNLNPF